MTGQFEEGQHFNAHLVQIPSKSKLSQGPIKIHVQNRRFSMTTGVPPRLVHSWNLADLRLEGFLPGQWVWLLPTPEIRGSNLSHIQFDLLSTVLNTLHRNTFIKK